MLKQLPLLVILFFLSVGTSYAQEAPIFSQNLTHGFLYNPSLAGGRAGQITVAQQRLWAQTGQNPTVSYLSANTPLNRGHLGLGVNIYNLEIDRFQTMFVSPAISYHMLISHDLALSFGFAGEISNTTLNLDGIRVLHVTDPLILDYPDNQILFDVSFGMNISSSYARGGFAFNRIMSFLQGNEGEKDLQEYYTIHGSLFLPASGGRDLFEPMAVIRKPIGGPPTLDIGAYYTLNGLITAGAAYRTSSLATATLGLKFIPFTTIGYTYQMPVGGLSGQAGSSQEITLSFRFNDFQMLDRAKFGRSPINSGAIYSRQRFLRNYSKFNRRPKKSRSSFRRGKRYRGRGW